VVDFNVLTEISRCVFTVKWGRSKRGRAAYHVQGKGIGIAFTATTITALYVAIRDKHGANFRDFVRCV
jgi:hypothetical protein